MSLGYHKDFCFLCSHKPAFSWLTMDRTSFMWILTFPIDSDMSLGDALDSGLLVVEFDHSIIN